MKRKEFLEGASWLAIGLFIAPYACAAQNKINDQYCEPTTMDALGPFYRKNAPLRNNVRNHLDTSNLLVVKGRVIFDDCKTMAKDVIIDFWQADSEGNYDNESSDYNYRAKVKTNNKGEYVFKTIVPGKYSNGKLFRPSHIHLRIRKRGVHELISQIYFRNDTHLATDSLASSKSAEERILDKSSIAKNEEEVIFNITLKKK